MICRNCGSSKQSKVINSRERKDFVSRCRQCTVCGYTYLTHETFQKTSTHWSGPRILWIPDLQNRTEAVWLEVTGTRPILTATSVKRITETTVEFDNGMVQIRSIQNKQWRVWDKRPTDYLRKKVKWK